MPNTKRRTLAKVAVGDVVTHSGSRSYSTILAVGESATVARVESEHYGHFISLYTADGTRLVRGTSTVLIQVAAATAKPLSPAMQRLVRALETYGYIDPIRDCSHGVGINTLVALMDRGIIREAKYRYGIHFPATTPEQVWDEAHAEDARRDAEQAAYLDDNTNWVQCTPDGDLDAHTRQTRDGQTIVIAQLSFRHWSVMIGDNRKMSAGGSWQEARRAADNFERNQAHAGVTDQEIAEAEAGWGQPDGMLGATEAQLSAEERDAHSSAYWERATEGMPRVPAFTDPAEAERRAVSVEHALVDVAALRELATYPALPVTRKWMTERLDRIEQALRGDQ